MESLAKTGKHISSSHHPHRGVGDGYGQEQIEEVELQQINVDAIRPELDTLDERREFKRQRKLQQIADEIEMKFSHSIQFNAVPEWSSNYLSYSNLKKLIYALEKEANHSQRSAAPDDTEGASLLGEAHSDPDAVLRRVLDIDLDKICTFYQSKEREIYAEVDIFLEDEEEHEVEGGVDGANGVHAPPGSQGSVNGRTRHGSLFKSFPGFSRKRRNSTFAESIEEGDEADSDADDDETAALQPKLSPVKSRSKTWDAHTGQSIEDLRSPRDFPRLKRRVSESFDEFGEGSMLLDSIINLKKRAVHVYVSLCELKSFAQLNKTGFAKVLKKYDKTLDRKLKTSYLEQQVQTAYPFLQSTAQELDNRISTVVSAFSRFMTEGDISEAERELRLHLREHVVWERNTVWREMIGIERKAQAAKMGVSRTMFGGHRDNRDTRLTGDAEEGPSKELRTPLGRYRCPRWLLSWNIVVLVGIFAVFIILVNSRMLDSVEQRNCLAMLVFVSLLWAFEAIPLFVTSLLIPFLVVVLRVVRSDDEPHHRLSSKAATRYIFAAMWTPVIMLLLGGFTIAAALSKYQIAKKLATLLLSKAGTKPRTVILTNMFVALVASMWISNVAAPVLCYSIIQPILRNLPPDSNMSKALILGIAFASNLGGMASPIASPQNIIALQNLKPQPSWGTWFFIALPVCVISIFAIWLLLIVTFQPGKGTTIVPIRPMKDKFSPTQWFISLVTVATIVLWCVTHQLEAIFGDMGIVAILPMALFFGTGILTKEDFNNFLWTVIILAAGGLSLGKAVDSSGLLHTIARGIRDDVSGMGTYGVLVVFSSLIIVVASFISHTVAALIVLPIVASVGKHMDDPHPNLLVMVSALMCSAAMALPTSGFPNMTAIMMEDSQTGRRYLGVKHFISRGVPSSLIAYGVVVTVGYGLARISGM